MEDGCGVTSPASRLSSTTSCISRDMDTPSTASGSVCSPKNDGVSSPLSLREVWEIYITAVKSQDKSADNVEKQSALLDLLLHLCWQKIQRGKIPDFSDMKSVCNQLCKEFMSDILHITSRSSDEDVTELQKYLLEGRGWLLLQVIHRRGVQSISGCRDLANLLVSLLPWCLKFPLKPLSDVDLEITHQATLPPISHFFLNILKTSNSKNRTQAVPMTRRASSSVPPDLGGKTFNDTSSGKRRYSKRKSGDSKEPKDDSENESAEKHEKQEDRSRGKKRKSRYFHIRSSADHQRQPRADSDSDDNDLDLLLKNIKTVESVTSGYELCMLILDLLNDLSSRDLVETSPGKLISPSILPHLLSCLASFDLSNEVTDALPWEQLAKRKVHFQMLRVTISATGVVASQPNGLNILVGHKVIGQILTTGVKIENSMEKGMSESEYFSEHIESLHFLSNLVVGLILCLNVVFEKLPFNLSFIKTAVGLIEDFEKTQGFHMLNLCIKFNDWLKGQPNDNITHSYLSEDEPIQIFGSFLNTMKIVRVNYQHSMKCVKRKHQKCTYAQYFDHHHDILGVPASTKVEPDSETAVTKTRTSSRSSQSSLSSMNSKINTQPVCQISTCTNILLDLLTKVVSKGTRVEILRTIYSSGVCCCMNLEHIVNSFVIGIEKFSPAVRLYAIDTLNKIILDHFMGGIPYTKGDNRLISCSYCDTAPLTFMEKGDKSACPSMGETMNPCGTDIKGLDSGIDSNDPNKEAKLSALYKISKWKPVGLLKNVLYSKNEALATSVAKHLLVLAVKGNGYLKAELFFSLYMHALEWCDDKGEHSINSGHLNKCLSKSVRVHCLSALPYLLQANCVTKAFLTKKGVRKLCELLQDNVLRVPVLKIFEALVALDEKKLGDVIEPLSDECPCPYKGGLVIDSFINELCRRSFDNDGDYYYDDSSMQKGRIRRDSIVLSKFSLPVLVDLWETCAKLCIQNREFVNQFQDCLRKSESLLLETLDVLISPNLIGFLKSTGSGETEDSGMEGDTLSAAPDVEKLDSRGFFVRVSLLESLMVVVGACHKHIGQHSTLPNKVKERFKHSIKLEPTKLKMLVDAFMNAAMPQFVSLLEFSYSRNVNMVYIRDDDIHDEDEVRQLMQTGSDEEHDVLTERGYEADSEDTHSNASGRDKQIRHLMMSRMPQKVSFPATFGMTIDILSLIQHKSSGSMIVNCVLHKLVQGIKADVNIVQAMCQQDVLSVVLGETGFWKCLLDTDMEKSVKDSLLAIVQHLGQHKLKSHDLQKILQLFQLSDIPMDQLLSVLLSIVHNSKIVAHHCVTFPAEASVTARADKAREPPAELTESMMTGSVSPLLKSVSSLFMISLPKAGNKDVGTEIVRGHQEVWDVCAILLPLKDALTWPPFQNGFSATLWMCLGKGDNNNYTPRMPLFDLENDSVESDTGTPDIESSVSQCLHVLSLGTREKLLEVWVNTDTGSLIFRLTSEVSEMGLVVQEHKLPGVMSPDRWQHLVISYVEGLDGSTLTGKATVVIDGWQSHSFVLDHPFSAIRARHKSSQLQPYLCLGHIEDDPALSQAGEWDLGNFMLCKGASIAKETCFHLFTLGPNCGSILKCDCSDEQIVYAPHLHKDTILHSKMDCDSLVGLKKPDLSDLRHSLLLSYNPKKCKEMSVYPPVSKVNQGHIPGNLGYTPDSLLTQQPRTTTPTVQGHIQTKVNSSLEKAIEESGGIASILFLVGKVYEKCLESMPCDEAEKVQSEALKVLLSIVQHSSSLEQEYISIGGHSLLCKVLTSCRSVVGQRVLKVLMDACTTESLYKVTPSTSELVLRHKSDAVICDASIIDQLILQWQIWEGGDVVLTELLFSGLANLVREDHPHQAFNVKQYLVIGLVNKMFKIYQERIQEGFPALPVPVSQSIVSIVQNMIGSPPDKHLIVDICDFILMVHPAANTYINHSRSAFYFTLPWGLPPSPLTQWKMGMISTPIKAVRRVKTPDKESKHLKQNLMGAFKANQKTKIIKESTVPEGFSTELTLVTKPVQNSESPEVIDAKPVCGNIQISETDSEHFISSERKQTSVVGNLSVDENCKMEENVESVRETKFDNNEGGNQTNLPIRIPSNFENLYKKAHFTCGDGTEAAEISPNVSPTSDMSTDDITDDITNDTGSMVSKEDLSLTFDEDNVELLKQEKGLTALCVGLLRLLSSVIVTMPDGMTEETFQRSIINPQTLIVLAQNTSSEVREAVIKVLASYLSRCNSHQQDHFYKIDGFHLLSAQLFQYPTHQEQVEAAMSIVMMRPFHIDEGLYQDETLEELSRIQQTSISVVLSLLGNSYGDLALCHNSLQFYCKLFETSDVVATVMVDQGIVVVLCNMLLKLFENGTRNTDVEGMDENEILLNDILDFLKVIAVREFSASGPQHYLHFEDMLVILQEMEKNELETQGLDSKSTQTLRVFQHHILAAILSIVEKASEEVSQQGFSLFSSKSQSTKLLSPHSYGSSPALRPNSSFPTTGHAPLQRNHPRATSQHFSLSGTFARLPFNKKSPGGYFIRPDSPYGEMSSAQSGSGGDSDSSQESFQSSASNHTVNLPVLKHGYSKKRSIDISQNRLVRSNSLLQTVLSIGKRKKLATIPISQNELIDRLKKMIQMAVDTALFAERKPACSKKIVLLFETAPQSVNVEKEFLKRLFTFAYRAFEATLPHEKSIYKRTKNVIMWGAKDVLRVQLGRLLSFMVSAKVDFDQRVYALSFVMGELRGKEVLKLVITAPELGNDLGCCIRDLLNEGKKLVSRQQVSDGSKFLNLLSSSGHNIYSDTENHESLVERKKSIEIRLSNLKTVWLKKKEASLNRILHQYDSLSSRLCDNAMEVTQSVTQLQTRERNKFITHIKHKKTESIQVKKQWQEIVQNLTHERALWYDEKSYPQCWQLNPTEGPCRVRKRLQRGHLGILPRFLKKEAQYKLATETVDPPLIYLFEDDHQISDSAALIYQLHKNNKIRYTSTCRAVSPNSESKGELLIGEDTVFFVADEAITDANYTQVLLGNKDQLSMTWPFEDVQEIQKRWYELSDTALEIFLTNGKTCLLALKTTKERDDLYKHLTQLELPSMIDNANLLDVVDRWIDKHLTNFEYLIHLNKIAGRSFNDLMQYPIMPFILRDYTSQDIDLRDKKTYRDLIKPVSVQEDKNSEKFVMNYWILKQEHDKFGKADITGLRVAPYHYGSHYSNSGSVLHFLVRLPPFTKMFLNFQDQSFDIPDRTFHNLHTSWRLSSAESNTDVKELIPEFFFSHEFLTNSEGFEFGKRQNNDPVHDVVLPPWCDANPRLFTLIHRQALESDYVTENICHWIDLVFGYKQQGDEAVKAINVFHPATYFGLDVSSVKNSIDRKALQTMVRTYGQTPKQLFKVHHPPMKVDYRKQEALNHDNTSNYTRAPILKHVSGLKWGSYLGSPDKPNPEVVWEEVYTSQVASLVALPTGLVFGISAKSCLVVEHSQEKHKMAIMSDGSTDVVWAAIVTWGQIDGLVRIINGKNKPPVNFIHYTQSDEIQCCVSVPDCRYLFTGGSSGVITIYNTKHNPAKESELQAFGHKRCLYGHTGAINALVVCKPYSIMVSASQDGTCIIWDLNRLSYVRSIKEHKSSVHVLAVSDTLGDIASVSHQGMSSKLYLHTVNAEYIAMVTCEDTINCLAYSTAHEGVSINIIAGGLSSGVIRMWSSWDLSHVRDLTYTNLLAKPIISLTFTKDSQKLYCSSADGSVTLWSYGGSSKQNSVKLRLFFYPSS